MVGHTVALLYDFEIHIKQSPVWVQCNIRVLAKVQSETQCCAPIAATAFLDEINCFVRAQKATPTGSAPVPAVRAAFCKLYRLHQAGEMYKVSDMNRSTEERLVHINSIDTKFAIACPDDEAPAAYFLPYAVVSGMR